jgi:2-iminobutanoate/2-iminopropanoate deaminase
MNIIFTKKAPKVVGPYSQAIEHNGIVYCSGQIGIDPSTGELVGNDIETQTRQVIKNLAAVLNEAGSTMDKVIKTTCFLKNMSDYQVFNEVYAEYFNHKPARATVEVAKLPKDALIEIEAIALI